MNEGIKREFSLGLSSKQLFLMALAGFSALFVTMLGFLSFAKASTSTSSDISLQIETSLAVSLKNCDNTNSSTMDLSLEPTPNGAFTSNCQTVTVDTNAPGYSLTAKSSSDTLNYLNPTTITPTPKISSTTALHSGPEVLDNNTWGFAVQDRLGFTGNTYVADNENNPYAQLPIGGVTVYQTDVFPAPAKAHTFYYGAKLNTDTMAGTYAATITYTAIGAEVVPPEYTQSYTTGSRFLFITSDEPIVRGSKIYVGDKECTNVAYTSSTTATCNTPAQTTGFKRVTIVPPPTSTVTMQNWTGCSALSIGDVVILNDERNNQNYRVRKMEDGKCWMIDNLKIADKTITSANSNITADTYTIPAVGTNGTTDDTPYVDDPALNSDLKNNCLNNMGTSEDSLTGCGYLYSWSAATAGTGNGLSSGNAPGSICPAGWHLPIGANAGEFAVLNNSMLQGAPSSAATTNTDVSRANWWSTGAFSGSYAGYIGGSTWGSQGEYSYWWSSSARAATLAYYANVSYSYLSPGTGTAARYRGHSIRCLVN